MAVVTQPRVGIPIGTVTIQGRVYDVPTHPEWVRFFESALDRIGGPTGSSSNDLTLSQFEDAGIEETKAALFAVQDGFNQAPPVVSVKDEEASPLLSALMEELALLRSRIDALEQGVSL